MNKMESICVIAEHREGKLRKSTFHAISFGREAAEKLGAALHIIVIGHGVAGIAEKLKGFGAAKIYLADHPVLEKYSAESWGAVTADVVRKCRGKIVGMSAGTTGKDLMPRVAAMLEAGMASGIIGFDGKYFSREMWSGSAVVEVEIKTDITAVTIQQSAFEPAEPLGGDTPVYAVNVFVPESKTRFIEMHEAISDRPDLAEAKVIISGGRGLKSRENFKLLEDFAAILGAAVGATRSAVDAGWVSNDLQVGQTGKIVAPDLYLAVGLSGAMQHTAGMKNSRVIVAVNKDAEAPIFQIADFGIVGDLFKIMPQLTEVIKKEKNA